MAHANPTPPPVSLFFGLLVADKSLFSEVERILQKEYSTIVVRSETMPFDMTNFYAGEMGNYILRRWVAVEWLIDPEALATIKNHTNRIERIWAEGEGETMKRRVNIDPGYLTPAKAVLASCKERDHRVYLRDGVFAEVTLSYKRASKRYESLPWTYPDYQTQTAQAFFHALRENHRQRASSKTSSE